MNLQRNGASAVILSDIETTSFPIFTGLENAGSIENTDFKLFGKPFARQYRRMGVALAYGKESTNELVGRAKQVAASIHLTAE